MEGKQGIDIDREAIPYVRGNRFRHVAITTYSPNHFFRNAIPDSNRIS